MKKKSEALKFYQVFEAWCTMQFGARIKTVRTDRGGEYFSAAFEEHLGKQGTQRITAPHDTPEYNGVSERLNRTILEQTRVVLHASGLLKFLWGEAASHIVRLKNRILTHAISEGTTLFEMLHKSKPDLSRIFDGGAPVWVHDASGNKLDARGVLGQWVGLDSDGGYHCVYWLGKHSISIERSVKSAVQEILIPVAKPLALEGERTEESKCKKEDELPNDDKPKQDNDVKTHQDTPANARKQRIWKPSRYVKEIQDGTIHTHHMPSLRNLLPKGMSLPQTDHPTQIEHALVSAVIEAEGYDPAMLKDARQCSDWAQWEDAIHKELSSLKATKTWILIE